MRRFLLIVAIITTFTFSINAQDFGEIINKIDFFIPGNKLQDGDIIVHDNSTTEIINNVSVIVERWSDKVDTVISAEYSFVLLDESANETVLSSVTTVSNSDFAPAWSMVSEPKYATLTFNSSTGKTGTVKVKYREMHNGSWQEYKYSTKQYSLKFYEPPLPATTFDGPESISDEAVYTIINPGIIAFENTDGLVTVDELGNNQYKLTRIGSANGKVRIKSTVGSNVYSKEINVGHGIPSSEYGNYISMTKQGILNPSNTTVFPSFSLNVLSPLAGQIAITGATWTLDSNWATIILNRGTSISISQVTSSFTSGVVTARFYIDGIEYIKSMNVSLEQMP